MDEWGAGRSSSDVCLDVQMSVTNRLRIVFSCIWVLTVIAVVVGWWFGKDPAQLAPVIGWLTAAVAAGEASNVGKRATFKQEACSVDT